MSLGSGLSDVSHGKVEVMHSLQAHQRRVTVVPSGYRMRGHGLPARFLTGDIGFAHLAQVLIARSLPRYKVTVFLSAIKNHFMGRYFETM